jgi:NADH dehydrogenase (ubiquinone) 1 alpha subcomplex subunit 10
MMRPSLVIIEGNISAGKSTLTRDLAAALGYRVFLEPTTTNPYLADFYRDPKRFALKMQIYLLRRWAPKKCLSWRVRSGGLLPCCCWWCVQMLFSLTSGALFRRYRVYIAALKHIVSTGEGVVLDRSIFSDWVFAEKVSGWTTRLVVFG